MRLRKSLVVASALVMMSAVTINALADSDRTTGRFAGGPVVYVTSLGLYFDSIVVADPLPMRGDFQQLIPTENGLETEYGPGQPGHRGGRWWVDVNGDGVQDAGDHFFLCPLLGPGREEF